MVIYLEEAVVLSHESGNLSAETLSLGNLGNAYMNLGRNDEAITYYQKALSLARQLQHRPNEAVNLANLANLYTSMGRYDEAFDLLTQGIEITNQIHDIRVLQALLLYQARNYWYRDNLPDALAVIQEAGKYDIGDNNHAVALTNGILLLLMDRTTEAMPLLETGLTLVDVIIEQSPQSYEAYFARGTASLA
ncbi:MAG TPA: tetratricopeptide repeat protein, partial [Aggregatilineales bacterium]|nr:tetratricopeptide repeat protein [Aggregatilineales bacterium]